MSAFNHLNEIVPLRIWTGVVGRAVSGNEASLVAVSLDPGTKVPEHSHANEQTGMLVSGSLSFRIGDEAQELVPGATWVIAADVPHSVDAGPEGAFLIELFAPPRADWADLERLEPSPPAGL
ncbi:MAG: cupin domain-containing protein [Gaiellaceae bacterium]